jgi:hypothetical protein
VCSVLGGGKLRSAVVSYLDDHVSRLLTGGSYREETGRQLAAACGGVSQLAGWVAYDSDEHGLAQRYLTQALAYSRHASDHALAAEVLAGQAHQALYLARPDEAIDLARAAQAAAVRHGSATLLTECLVMEAHGLGRPGVGHRYDEARRRVREGASQAVMGVQVAEHEAAAVEKDGDGQLPSELGAVDADRHVADRGTDDAILNRVDGLGGRQHRDHAAHALACSLGGESVEVAEVGCGQARQVLLDLRVERHCLVSFHSKFAMPVRADQDAE